MSLRNFLRDEKQKGKKIFPRQEDIFNALKWTPFESVKVVILGQDPYHGAGQAHGLSFSVPKGVKVPPSLVNIKKEIHRDLELDVSSDGDLTAWAEQGVLLLNSVLTVEEGRPGSHQGKGWEDFTDKIVNTLNESERPLVFLLWGGHAQKKGDKINGQKHLVLSAPHPSPLSAYRGFIGCNHFSMANDFLTQNETSAIDWS